MKRVFVDTSAWYAYINALDPDHGRVQGALDGLEARLITSNFVFDEVVTLCRYRLGHRTAVRAGKILLDGSVLDLIRVMPEDERSAWSTFQSRKDKAYSFTDCTSFELMRRLGLREAVALDADFRQEGFDIVP